MDESSILIIGANGQLGLALQRKYPKAQKVDTAELDITNKKALKDFDWTNFRIVINAAAYTNVDGAETTEGRVAAWQVNAVAVGNLVKIASEYNFILLHISTDYVFNGRQKLHTEEEQLSPLSAYGASKAAGDIIVSTWSKYYIFRTSFVIGEGKNFVRIMLELGQKGINPAVIADQLGRITFASELARAVDFFIENQPAFGTYNVSNGGEPTSWAALTREIFKFAGFKNNVTGTTTAEYYKDKPQSAVRPLNSVLDLSKIEATGFKPVDWRTDLEKYVKKESGK